MHAKKLKTLKTVLKSISNKRFELIQRWDLINSTEESKELKLKFQLIFEFIKYPKAEHHRLMYDDLANECLNMELKVGFNLSAYSEIDYCVANSERKVPLGKN